MKIRITARMLAVAMLLILLSGCGMVKTELEATAVETTEAPTTEPTMEPTEPPTVLEQLGVELWEGAQNVGWYEGWEYHGVDLPVSGGMGGTYDDFKIPFWVKGENGREVRAVVSAPTDMTIFEFPASGFECDNEWMKEKLAPFYDWSKEQKNVDLSYEEWIGQNQNKKLVYLQIYHEVDGTELLLKAREEQFGKSEWSAYFQNVYIIDSKSGETFATNHANPEIGCWSTNQEEKDDILVKYQWYAGGWYGEHGTKNSITQEMCLLVPTDCDDICFMLLEHVTAEESDEYITGGGAGEGAWNDGNILDWSDDQYKQYKCHIFGME